MPYFTSWDVNTYLSLLSWGLPEDVVKRMMKMTKKVHREFTLGEAMTYWISNSPTLVKHDFPKDDFRKFKYVIHDSDKVRAKHKLYSLVNYLTCSTVKFKQEWRYRSVEERHKKVADWCYFGSGQELDRHQKRLNTVHMPMVRSKIMVKTESKLLKERKEYVKNLWPSWEAGASSYYFVGSNRRDNVRKWYEGIHPGRFFLFYRENKIIQERNRGIPKGPCKDGYVYPRTPIYDWGPYEQLIEDLRCIDGAGLGEKVGRTVEHIDDMFLKV